MTLNKSKTTKIIAPAGCGKTTRLLEICEDILASGTAPETIVFTTFTRAAANEAAERAAARFGFDESRLCYFRTLHSFCLRHLGRRNVMGFRDYLSIARSLGLFLNLSSSATQVSTGGISKGDHLLHLTNFARLTFQELETAYQNYHDNHLFSPFEAQQFRDTLDAYKQEFDKIDYTDMLEEYLTLDPRLDISYLIVDETQDLCPLQWRVVEQIAGQCRHTYLAGDDDQCIHEYAGASPDILIDLDCHVEHRPQSFRVPGAVQRVATGITRQISKRIDKELRPRPDEGEVYHAANIEDIVLGGSSDDTWLLLARNTHFFGLFEEALIRQAVLYLSPQTSAKDNTSEFRAEVVSVVREYEKLRNDTPINAGDLAKIYKYTRPGKGVQRGYRKIVENLHRDHEVTLKEAVEQLGLMRADPWDKQLLLTDTEKSMIHAILRRGQSLSEPKVEISTIHSAKGREADNVILLPDMTFKTWQSFNRDPEPEHRVWYVGVTRAKKRLYVLSPYTNMFYPL
jgi:superfamily I DNA/RNA helicase